MTFKNLCLILLAFTTLSCSSRQKKSNLTGENKIDVFYSVGDFASVKKFDVHIHINTDEITFIEQAKRDNFRFLDIVDDRPFGLPMAAQQAFAIQHLRNFPADMAFATTFPVNDWNNSDWAEKTISGLKQSIANGARAVKIWKNIGMDLREKDGTFVMVDNPKLRPVLDYLEKNKIPLIGHNGEPRDCWLPLDKMTFSKGYYSGHPEYHMFLHPEYPSYEDQINARDNMLKAHPNLQFVGAHLGSLEWSLDELAKRLERFPNMRVDLSRMSNLKLHALNDWDKTRGFFIKYQDRLVYGSDRQVNAASGSSDLAKGIHESWMRDWEFFVADEKITLSGFGDLKGLKLPKEVVDKIYSKNAERWLSAL